MLISREHKRKRCLKNYGDLILFCPRMTFSWVFVKMKMNMQGYIWLILRQMASCRGWTKLNWLIHFLPYCMLAFTRVHIVHILTFLVLSLFIFVLFFSVSWDDFCFHNGFSLLSFLSQSLKESVNQSLPYPSVDFLWLFFCLFVCLKKKKKKERFNELFTGTGKRENAEGKYFCPKI